MALRWIEGFETRITNEYMSRLYATYAGITFTSGTSGRKHGTAFQGANAQWTTPVLVGSFQNTWIFQWALRKIDLSPVVGLPGVTFFRGSGNDQFEMRIVAASSPDDGYYRLELLRGATQLAISAPFAFGNTSKAWNVFQLKVTIDPTVGAYEVRGWDWQNNQFTAIAAATGQNTANQGSAGADIVRFRTGTQSGAQYAIDDLVIWDSTGTGLTDFTSKPLLVFGELPNADVAGELDWVPSSGSTHFALVDDQANASGGTDEVASENVGDVDLYGFSQVDLDLIPGAPTVHGIMVDVEALMKNSGSRTIRVRFKDGVNQADDTTDLVFNNTAKASFSTIVLQNPTGTPAAWTVATLKTIELGPKLNA